jgi:hypothetical protein
MRASIDFDRYSMTFQIVLEQRNGFLNQLARVKRSIDTKIFPEVRPDALDHSRCAMAIGGDLSELRFCLVEIGSRTIEPA